MKKYSRVKKTIVFALISIIAIAAFSLKAGASSVGFGVVPEIPDNQVNKNLTYFDLKTTPGMQETIKVKITNDSNKSVTLEPVVNTSKTNYNGVIEYQNTKLKSDKTLPADIGKIVTPLQKQTTIAANSSQEISFSVNMPDKQFKGQLIGGMVFKDTNQTTRKSGISNQYAYVVGVVLHGYEDEEKNSMSLGQVFADQNNYRNVITADLRNTSAKIISKLSVTTKITKQGSSNVLYTATQNSKMVAPNSIYPFPTSLNNKELKSGNYTIDVVAKTKTQKWHFKKNFKITGKVAKKLNDKAVNLEKDYTWLYTVVIIMLIILLMVLFYYLRKKKNAERALKSEIEALKNK